MSVVSIVFIYYSMFMEFDKSVPIPKPRRDKYQLGEMGVGDSFLIKSRELAIEIMAACHYYGLRPGITPKRTFSVRRVDGGWRCWRVT